MSSGLKTRNPLILFESNSNSNVPSRQVARNPITQGDTNVQPIQYSKKAVERNPILQADSHPVVRTSQSFINKTVSRNPIIADPNEHLVKVRDNNTYKDSNIFGEGESQSIRPSTGKAKHNPTYSSTLFGGPKADLSGRKKLVTDLSTDQLFGEYRDPPVKKPQNKQYQPNFTDMLPEQRRYLEVFGNEMPPQSATKVNKKLDCIMDEELQEKDAFSKKINSLEGNDIFCENKRPHTTKATKTKEKFFAKTKWDSQVSKPSVNNERRDTDGNYAFAKKQEEFQKSNIFGQDHENVIAPQQKQEQFHDDLNTDKRKQIRNYSDLFNLPQYENNPNSHEEKNEGNDRKNLEENEKTSDPHSKRLKDLYSVLASDGITKTYKDSLSSSQINNEKIEKKFEGKTAKDLKKLELKSNMMGNEKEVNYDNLKNPLFYDFDVKGLNQDFDPNNFQNFCAEKGYHLVEFKANTNTLNTSNNGTGRLKIRIGEDSNLVDIKSKLSQMGMNVNDHTEKHELKQNYVGVAKLDWKDANLAGQERRLHGNDFVDAKESKMKDLESNGDVFGNSKGVGQWDSEWKDSQKNKKGLENNYTPENNVQTLNWKKSMKNLDKMKNPMYKAGTSFQNKKLFSSTSSKVFSTMKK